MHQNHKHRVHNCRLMAVQATEETGLDPALAAKSDAAVALLRDAVRAHGRVVYANSLGAEAMVLTDLICTAVPAIDIFSIDTGRLPEETLGLLDRLERRYQRRIRLYYPDTQQIEQFVRERGINGFYESLEARLRCCEIRKVEPFRRAIAGYGAWVTGVRREQSETRSQSSALVRDERYGLAKISPLLEWTESEVWAYIRARALPYNPLHDRGYPSIGCAPCTRAIEPGQDHRAGRWWWEHPESRECGLHPRTRPGAGS
jgi:phosphoadenosine phosphosulfate reductase